MSRAVKGLIFTWIAIGLLLAIGGGFYWGMKYQEKRCSSNVGGSVIPNQIGTSPSASSNAGSQSDKKVEQPSGNASGDTNQNGVK